ncbi:UNVERIFIED_CONTAM: hypothetical protein Scaly_1207900 [Sesamum calycinum]|uniref:X8 domain-containing protein n=1 Tax=Sesamum calycinum TaxID=2727403 RepID=A0AAW2Q441_9LAMI
MISSRRTLVISCLPFIHLAAALLLSSSSGTSSKTTEPRELAYHEERKLQDSVPISTRQMDITTPITTVPTPSNPTLNPTDSNPESPVIMNPANPVMTPLATNSPAGSWCIASRSVSQTALQAALDYACGQAGADCSAIQANGVYGACRYPSTSTSSSVLNKPTQADPEFLVPADQSPPLLQPLPRQVLASLISTTYWYSPSRCYQQCHDTVDGISPVRIRYTGPSRSIIYRQSPLI